MSKSSELFQMMREESGLDSERIDMMEKRYQEEMEYKEWYNSEAGKKNRDDVRNSLNNVFMMFHPVHFIQDEIKKNIANGR